MKLIWKIYNPSGEYVAACADAWDAAAFASILGYGTTLSVGVACTTPSSLAGSPLTSRGAQMKLKWKIYNPSGEYVAACAYAEDAAALASVLGDGTTVRADHSKAWTCWTEGVDGNAYESYDEAAAHMRSRLTELQRSHYTKHYGEAAYERAINSGVVRGSDSQQGQD
jgi:hypothetical protein